MKKLALALSAILVIALTSVALVACSNATTQGQLENVWLDGETYVYEVTDTSFETPKKGVYTVEIKGYGKGATVEGFGDTSLENVAKGFLVTCELNMDNEAYESVSKNYFQIISGSSFMVPYATYTLQKENGAVVFEMSGRYSGTTLNYKMSVNGGEETTGSVFGKSPLYDNNQIHQVLRSAPTLSTSFAFSFSVPVASKNEVAIAQLNASCSSKSFIKNEWTENYKIDETPQNPDKPEENTPYKANGIECFKVILSRSTNPSGKHHTLYYAASDVKLNGWPLKKVLVQFEEPTENGTVVYTLTKAEIKK